MPEPTPKRSDAMLVAKRLETPPEEAQAKQPAGSAEVIVPKSSPVIAKSQRVRELPPPPVIVRPIADAPPARDMPDEPELPDGLVAPKKKTPEPSIQLDALQIRTNRAGSNLRGRVRVPPHWQQWLTDPQRRNSVGTAASVAIHVVLVALLAFVFMAPPRLHAPPPLPARTFQAAAETAPASLAPNGRVPEPIVRQEVAESLETVAVDSPNIANAESPDESGISNLKSEISNSGSASKDAAPDPRAQAAAIDPPKLSDGPAASGAPAPAPVQPAPAAEPGMSNGSLVGPDLLQAADALMPGKLKRRTLGGRSEGVRYGGGTPQSEEAVERAVRWIVAHQRPNGSWSFNHISEACQHYCTNPGSEPSTTGATGMALLPLLGAGYTHKQGEFQDVVQHGLDYLKQRGMKISYGIDMRDGSSMYGHALATIALCEAYGMTGDKELKDAAQGGLDYIAYAQDLKSGGWRYNPGEPGDTTVTGWMLMALKSGQMARLNIQSPAIFAAEKFLDSVQNKDGSQYGYLTRKPGPGTSAVGLLCRMYTGWRRTNPGLVKGAAQLGAWGPSKDNMYFDYYATQVLFHFAGPEWDGWNHKMRELLIVSQEREGHQAGSWYFDSPQSAAGGRLYNTAMAAMILEVYYRFMPLYGEEAVEGKPEP